MVTDVLATVTASSFRPLLPVVIAEATGAFERSGLKLRHESARSSDDQLQQLLGGEIDIAHTALDNVAAWRRHADVRVIAVIDLGVAHELVARPEISAVAGLAGKVIGVDSPHNGLVVLLRRLLAEHGLERGGYQLRELGGLEARGRAFAAGACDACLLAGRSLERARADGNPVLLAVRAHLPRYPALALVAVGPLEGERRELLGRYVGVLSQAVTKKDVDVHAVAELLAVTPERANDWLAAERARITGVVRDSGDARAVIRDALLVTGRIAPGDSIDAYLDLLMDGV
ncbi:MAG: ABC transporter substrate-binding protein [Solirubrobacterales bacterium]|nr:ABC transporter substrate-binding protein [Solirubrobacterales bacterium]